MARRLIGGLCALGMATALAGATAGADPKTPTIPVVCDNGQSYEVVVNGNGQFTPAHDTSSTAVFIPVSFGTFTGSIRNTQGQVVDIFTEPGSEKGQASKGLKDALSCTYTISEVSDGSDPGFPAGYTFSGTGSVVGKIVPGQ